MQLVLKKRRTEVRRIAAGFEKKENGSAEDCTVAGFEKKEKGCEGGLQLVMKKKKNGSEEDCSWL